MMIAAWITLCCFIMLAELSTTTNCQALNISVIVTTQPLTRYFTQRHMESKKHFSDQLPVHNVQLKLFHTNYDENSAADWIVSSLLLRERNFFLTQQWIFVCDDDTRVDLQGLISILSSYNPTEVKLVGRGLYDDEPTIIHHFEFHDGDTREFRFPGRAFGYAMSNGLVRKLIHAWRTSTQKLDFRIDVEHELAMTMKKSLGGVLMTPRDDVFCMEEKSDGCVTWLLNTTRLPDCGNKALTRDIYFAVKTCEKFLDERIPVIQHTWANDTDGSIGYFAEVKDEEVPTIKLNIANYNLGFCLKFLEILQWFWKNKKETSWLVVTDDDTLMSVSRLQHFLGCCDPKEAAIIGERYGYRSLSNHGYDFITGGGGIVLSRAAVEKLMKDSVSCPTPDSPDDMTLGMWAKNAGIPLLHSPLFHQARPMDYSGNLINKRKSISFHKFWNINPELVYQRWLLSSQRQKEFMKKAVMDHEGLTEWDRDSRRRKKKRKKKMNTRHTTRLTEEL